VPLTAADVAFTYNYIVKNDMANFTNYTVGIKSGQGPRPDHGADRLLASQGRPREHVGADPAQAHLGSTSPPGGGHELRAKLPLVGSGPFQTVAFKKGSYIEMVRNPYYWGPKPAIDKIYFEIYQDADTMVTDLKSGNLDAAWGIPEAAVQGPQVGPGLQGGRLQLLQLGLPRVQLLRQVELAGQPGAARLAFRNALNYAIDRQRSRGRLQTGWPARRPPSSRPAPG
jgi:ABC-type transport system substrate-binding protein